MNEPSAITSSLSFKYNRNISIDSSIIRNLIQDYELIKWRRFVSKGGTDAEITEHNLDVAL